MKKSKFLKKSLAMLLAVMLVVAMIPLSAAAAEDDPEVYVDLQEASLSGTTYSVEAADTTVDISWTVQGTTKMVIVKNDETTAELPQEVNLADDDWATQSGDVYTVKLQTQDTQADDSKPVTKDYTLEITVKEVVESDDATIKALTNYKASPEEDGELAGMAKYLIDDDTITITFKFGATLPSSLSKEVFVCSNDEAEAEAITSFSTDGKAEMTVTAEDGTTKTYTVVLKSEEGIKSFTVPEQTEASKIEGTDITIKVPYGYEMDKVVPTFELADGVLALTTSELGYDKDVITSGETEVDFTETTGDTVYAWYGKETADHVALDITLDDPDENPEALLKTIKVGSSNAVEIAEGTTAVTVELPAGFKFDSDAAKAVTVTGTVSANADVTVSAQGKTAALSGDKSDTYTFKDNNAINVSGKTFTITVKSQDDNTTKNYTITLTAAASAEANLNDFSVKYTDDDNKETVYTAENGTLTIPYSAKLKLDEYKVLVQASAGASVMAGGNDLKNTGATLADLGVDATKATNKITVTVTAQNAAGESLDKRTYTITVKWDAAKTGKALTSAGFVGTDNEAEITGDNTYTAAKGTVKVENAGKTETKNAIKVTVPFSYKETASYVNVLNISEGAVAYLVDEDTATKVELVGTDADEGATPFEFNDFEAVEDGKLTGDALTMYVLSEQEYVDNGGDDAITAAKVKEKGNLFYIYAVKAEAATGNSMTSISSTLDENVKATLSGKQVTITVPYSYNKNGTEFSLNFKLSKLASLFANTDTSDPEAVLKSDNGSEETENPTEFKVSDKKLYIDDTEVTSFTVKAEGTNGDVNPYTVKVVVNDAEKGAELTAVTVNGIRASISGKTVTVNLPFGTNLYPVKLGLTASKMATILVNGEEYDENENYDLNTDITIKVISENDGATINTYTLKATTADQFSDVDTDDWYYNNVMRAVELGILSGYTDGTFRPMNNITRRDFAIMLAQSLGHDNDEKATSPFKDVADTDYGVSSIAYLYENEITVGDSNGNFNPDANITRQEAAIMLVKAFEATGTSSDLYADDAQIASWAKSFVYTAKAAGLMKGDDHNEFNPTDRLTRAEAASAMVNAVDN